MSVSRADPVAEFQRRRCRRLPESHGILRAHRAWPTSVRDVDALHGGVALARRARLRRGSLRHKMRPRVSAPRAAEAPCASSAPRTREGAGPGSARSCSAPSPSRSCGRFPSWRSLSCSRGSWTWPSVLGAFRLESHGSARGTRVFVDAAFRVEARRGCTLRRSQKTRDYGARIHGYFILSRIQVMSVTMFRPEASQLHVVVATRRCGEEGRNKQRRKRGRRSSDPVRKWLPRARAVARPACPSWARRGNARVPLEQTRARDTGDTWPARCTLTPRRTRGECADGKPTSHGLGRCHSRAVPNRLQLHNIVTS